MNNLQFIMPFGEHAGKEIGDVPIDYLRWLWREGKTFGTLKSILEEYEDEISEAPNWFVAPLLKEVANG